MAHIENMKGLLLAGGTGSRLFPATLAVNKHLLVLYDKPLIYYTISLFMKAGIRDITIVASDFDLSFFKKLLGDGNNWGLLFTYVVQDQPRGTGHALQIGTASIGSHDLMVCLADNLFVGWDPTDFLAKWQKRGAMVFTKEVDDLRGFGVVNLDFDGNPVSIVEKPDSNDNGLALTGFYLLDRNASEIAFSIRPSERGELEITDVIARYMDLGVLEVAQLDESTFWSDVGTHDAWHRASNHIREVQAQSSEMIGCPEEIALRHGWVPASEVQRQASRMNRSAYGEYLRSLVEGRYQGKLAER